MHYKRLENGMYEFNATAQSEANILAVAEDIMLHRMLALSGEAFDTTNAAADYLRMKIGHLEHEEFVLVYLTGKHRVITAETLFRGTIDGAAVYPREVVKAAIRHNAAAVIACHNHPSGGLDPSHADHEITKVLSQALDLIEVRMLDHIIVNASDKHFSFAEHGRI